MSSLALPPPLKVPPLTKFVRWTLLLSGIYYGINRRRSLAASESKLREKMKPMADERKTQQRIQNGEKLRIEAVNIANELGMPLPPEFYKPCYGQDCREAYAKRS